MKSLFQTIFNGGKMAAAANKDYNKWWILVYI